MWVVSIFMFVIDENTNWEIQISALFGSQSFWNDDYNTSEEVQTDIKNSFLEWRPAQLLSHDG